jgi:hypothetical protein
MVKNLVLNPQDVSPGASTPAYASSTLPPDTVEYLIITESPYDLLFAGLLDWKLQRGIRAKAVNISWITANYAGYDTPEKIRNFLKDAYAEWGVIWVLLGGDTGIVPARMAYSGPEGSVPCDLYYADLDGDWDANANHVYGEPADRVDMRPELIVGRASVDTWDEAYTFVDKVKTYEKYPPYRDYALKAFFMGFDLDVTTPTEEAKRAINLNYLPPRYAPIDTVYDSMTGPHKQGVIDQLNAGHHIVNHSDHGVVYISEPLRGMMGTGATNHNQWLEYPDVDALHNGDSLSIVFSVACVLATIDVDCQAERFVNNPNGGGIAFIGNTRDGFYYPGAPGQGPGDQIDAHFFNSLFTRGYSHLGQAVADCRNDFVTLASTDEYWRHQVYETILVGDPELPVWTDTPETLSLAFVDSIPVGELGFPVWVTSRGSPVDSALVCVWKGDEVYQTGYTDSRGAVTLDVRPATVGELLVTATKHNCIPAEDSAVVVVGNFPYLYIGELRFDDQAGGNGDGSLDPGETAEITLCVRNAGTVEVTDVFGLLETDNFQVTVASDSSWYGSILPESTALGGIYRFRLDETAPDGVPVAFLLQVKGNGGAYAVDLPFTVDVPQRFDWVDHDPGNVLLTVTKYGAIGVMAPGGEGNGFRHPADNTRSMLYQGSFLLGDGPDYVMDRQGSSIDWAETERPDGRLKVFPGDTLEMSRAIFSDSGFALPRGITVTQEAEARPGAQIGDVVLLKYRFTNNGALPVDGLYAALYADFDVYTDIGYSANLAFVDTARDLAFVKWGTYNPYAGICALGPRRATSWSVIDNGVYAPGKDLPDSNKIKFMEGALQILSGASQKDWSVLVSHGPFALEPGQTDSVAYAVIGGADLAELQASADTARFYLGWESTGLADGPGDGGFSRRALALYQNSPNPVGAQTRIQYSLPTAGQVTLSIYNLAGQLVQTVVSGFQEAGLHSCGWNCRDTRGATASSGVYFYRLTTAERSLTRRMVVVK